MSILKEYIENNKNKVKIGAGIAAGIVVISVFWLGIRKNAYVVSVEGKVLGIIKTKEEAQQAYDEVVKGIDEKVNVPFTMNETLQVEPIHSSKDELSSYDMLTQAIAKSVSYEVEGYEILVDGVSYGAVATKEEATALVEKIATKYAPQNGKVTLAVDSEVKSETTAQAQTVETVEDEKTLVTNDTSDEHKEEVSKVTIAEVEKGEEVEEEKPKDAQDIKRTVQSYDFNEEVVVQSTFVEQESIMTAEQAEETLLGNRYEVVDYKMVEGDNIWDIAVAFGTTDKRILELNPAITDETKVQIGQVLKVEKAIPILSVTTVEESVFKELIPGEIQYKPSEQFYEGETKVIVEGNDGIKQLKVAVTKVNGKEVSRTTLSEEILKKEKVTVIAYGVKEKVEEEVQSGSTSGNSSSNSNSSSSNNSSNSNSNSSNNSSNNNSSSNSGNSGSTSSSSRYIHPLKGAGRISSTYGPRWGTFHYGIDYAAPAGTPIYASRAGKVIYSAYNQGGYGKLIIIEHNDGTQSYYGHCSSLYVQVGQNVGQGERIAGVGTTGQSTGNHLHFEIRVNGKPVNPANYL